ncbi:MAG TPA: hypothetical protein VIT23_16205, partial [Terrimicrobiaceae bacterium]
SIPNGNASFRAEGMGFDLAADFLYSIVIPVDLMTFQTGDIRNTSKKLACAALGSAVDAIFPHGGYAGIDGRYSHAGNST